MVSFLFWNVNRNPVQEIVAEFAELYEIDVIILAESSIEESNMVYELNPEEIPVILLLPEGEEGSTFIRAFLPIGSPPWLIPTACQFSISKTPS